MSSSHRRSLPLNWIIVATSLRFVVVQLDGTVVTARCNHEVSGERLPQYTVMPHTEALRKQLADFIDFGEAHATAESAMAELDIDLQGKRPTGLKHSPWEILEHIRITQHDILEFCRNSSYEEMKWPDDYWPRSAAPPSDDSWRKSVAHFETDRNALRAIAKDKSTHLFATIPHGTGQTYLRELLVAQDHLSYHVGQLVAVRQLLGAWHVAKK
ncbi:MAG: DinB family protein [Gemmatimonadaceae bacterium]|nr:DinB family protein [Gemmatimonadaceae bacterium]